MHKFIRNIIERLRRFIQRWTRDTAGETAPPIRRDEASLAVTFLDRFGTAVLTRSGILFQGIRYHDRAIAEMLLHDLSCLESGSHARAKVTIKWDPSDVASISVWNRAARPRPRWVTVPIADAGFREGTSFRQYEHIRQFAKDRHLAFSTEEERRDACERIRQHWEKLASRPPVRASRQSPSDVDPWADPLDDLIMDNIVDAEIDTAPSDADGIPKRRRPSKATVANVKRAKASKKVETSATPMPRLPDTERK